MTRPRVLPPTCLLIAILLMVALHFVCPIRQIIRWPYRCLGAAPILLGAWLNCWADRLFTRVKTTVKPFEQPAALITGGPYRVSRHPMYLGMLLILIGLGVALGSALPFLIVPLFGVFVDRGFIAAEEQAMTGVFGDTYRAYQAKVRRWI